jgi:small GTP-binding protein
MSTEFQFDVFLSHSSRDKAIVRGIADRLKRDGVRVWFDEWEIKPGDSISAKVEEGLEHSRVLVLCMSANAFGSDWAQLEGYTFRFRDPLNRERRFIPLRLDDGPIKSSLAQFLCINWLPADRQQEYVKLFEACQTSRAPAIGVEAVRFPARRAKLHLCTDSPLIAYAFSSDVKRVVTGGPKAKLSLWDVQTGQCLGERRANARGIRSVAWNVDNTFIFSGSDDGQVRLWDPKNMRCKRAFVGHKGAIYAVACGSDSMQLLSGSEDATLRLWNTISGECIRIFKGHESPIYCIAWSPDRLQALSGSEDGTLKHWSLEAQENQCLQTLSGHAGTVQSVAWSSDQCFAVSGSSDTTVRLWDIRTGKCLKVFEGHTGPVRSVSWSPNRSVVLSASWDRTVRAWDVESGNCVGVSNEDTASIYNVTWGEDGKFAFTGNATGGLTEWDLSGVVFRRSTNSQINSSPQVSQIQYTNAKVLLVGDSHVGKTGLTHRLATGDWKPSEDSTVGAWSTQWPLKDASAESGVDREIWLWDFGGQADQRLIHQLYMDHAALILLLFNADQEDVLPGLRDWLTALRRCVKEEIPHFLVAGRIDTGFKASRGKLQTFAKEQGLAYYETSAKSGEGCDGLRLAMVAGIPWEQMEQRTSPRVFKLIKDEILKLRDEGQVLHTFKELRELLWQRLPDEPRFTDKTLQTVIGLLDGPGVVRELDYGTYVLLAPEWINAYAQAVIRTLRSAENNLGVLPLRSIAEGKLIYQSIGRDGAPMDMKRLPAAEERVVLGEMERQLEQRGLCLRQGDKLVFPSHCGRDRPSVMTHPSIFVSYAVKGFLDDIYATLVVKLADSGAFSLKDLWRDAADFDTLGGGHRMGIKLTRDTASSGHISVYFGPGVTQEEQVIFANYINAHLIEKSGEVQRLRYYVCPYCHTPKGNPQVLMEKLLSRKHEADTECDKCGERFTLWDVLEKKFASKTVREEVEGLQAVDMIRLDSRRKGKLLALEVGARIASADQKSFEIPVTEDEGLDVELEFTDDEGKGTGSRLYLQLKAGNSYLSRRKTDKMEVFKIKKQSWVKYWLKQPHPVMLVVGTFAEDKEVHSAKEKLEFADVRWMEIKELLRRESDDGKKPVKQIIFKGERLDVMSVRRWREKILNRQPRD